MVLPQIAIKHLAALDRAAGLMAEAHRAARAADLQGDMVEVQVNAWVACRAACRLMLLGCQERPS